MLAGATALLLAALFVAIMSVFKLGTAIFFSPKTQIFVDRAENINRKSVNPDLISDRHFFGVASDKQEIQVDDLPETKLELTLRGAFAATEKEASGAIIEDDKKIAQKYEVGDELPGNVTLSAVYSDRVVLSRNGNYETLYFPSLGSDKGLDTKSFNNNWSSGGSRSGDNDGLETQAAKERRDAIRERIRQLRGK